MPDIQLIKLSIRRGTDEQRQKVVLEQAEFGYTTDHKRLWVGDGVLSGGNIIGAKVHSPLAATGDKLLLGVAHTGDVVYENNLLFQLSGTDYATATDWGAIYTKPDAVYIDYNTNNELTIVNNSITGDKFDSTAAFASGGIKATLASGLSAHPDNVTIEIANSAIAIKNDGVDETKIISSALYNGLSGGSGDLLQLSVNLNHFGYIGTILQLSALPGNIVTFDSINEDLIGNGLIYDGVTSTIQAYISGVNSTLTTNSGVIGLATIGTGDVVPLAEVTKDIYGRVTQTRSSIWTGLTASNTTSALLSVFNGYPGQVDNGRINNLPLTIFSVSSSDGTSTATIQLSSAGFITFENIDAQDGTSLGRVAIPVYNY
jgi:hypothetical protein